MLAGVGIGLLSISTASGADYSWNPLAASDYLQERQHVWNGFTAKMAKERNQPQKESCISCHTGLPYVLVQPAFSKVFGERSAGADTRAMVERIRYRLQHPDAAPYYGDASMHSRSFESVLYAVALAIDDREKHLKNLSPDAETAFQNMWREQTRTGELAGSWGWEEAGEDPWATRQASYFGTTLAVLAIGYAPPEYMTRPELGKSIESMATYLRNGFNRQNLHDRLAALWAASVLPNLILASDRNAALEVLRRAQNQDGGWSIRALGPWKTRPGPEGGTVADRDESDGYATAFAACCLEKAGFARSAPETARALSWLAVHQDPKTGAWEGRSLNGNWNSNKGPVISNLVGDAATAYAFIALSAGN